MRWMSFVAANGENYNSRPLGSKESPSDSFYAITARKNNTTRPSCVPSRDARVSQLHLNPIAAEKAFRNCKMLERNLRSTRLWPFTRPTSSTSEEILYAATAVDTFRHNPPLELIWKMSALPHAKISVMRFPLRAPRRKAGLTKLPTCEAKF